MEFDLSTLQPKERASFALRALYEAAGCRKYHMGRFEEYSLYQANRSFLSSEQVITFTDLDGRLLALKPDVTLSIAKTAQPAPGETLRYYYHENVYRPSAESHTFKEIGQMGLEFLGGVGEAEVQQAVCLAAQSLGQLGTDWVLEVSHMGYLFGLLDALQVPEDARAGLLRKLGQKNAHELRAAALAAGLDEDAADTLCLVLADGGCNPAWVAADLLSQAEHDKLASPVLVTDSADLAKAVQAELEVQIPQLPRAAIARASVDDNGKIIVCTDLHKAIEACNIIAPEHLEVCVEDPFGVLNEIKNAGSIFLGRNVPEALGDYFAGPNHTLPTSGTARFSSPLGVDDFVKKSSFLYYTREALGEVAPRIADFAEREGLHAHAKSVTIRYEK